MENFHDGLLFILSWKGIIEITFSANDYYVCTKVFVIDGTYDVFLTNLN